MSDSVIVLMTCHNRRQKSVECLSSLLEMGEADCHPDSPQKQPENSSAMGSETENHNGPIRVSFLIVDDGSSDQTAQALEETARSRQVPVWIIHGDGNLFWAGGMRLGMKKLLRQARSGSRFSYVLMVNDDVSFYPGALSRMIARSKLKGGAVISGATEDEEGKLSYGGIVYEGRGVSNRPVEIKEADITPLHAANCNCLLLPCEAFMAAGAFDESYAHSMADYDYSFQLRRLGYEIYLTDFIVGRCTDNPAEGSWRDSSLTWTERFKRKESPKGLPAGEWFHFLRKNFGLRQALWHSVTPYIRIITGK